MRKTRSWSLVSVLLLALGACAGEDTSEVAAVAESGGGGAITIFTDRTELFFEYPPMVAGAPGGVWAVHLTNLADFQAVTVGRLTLEFEDSDGRKYTTVDEQPSRPGVFGPTPSLPTAGMYDLVMTLEGSQVSDEILVGQIRVYASQDDLPPLVEAEEVGISFLKEQQWPIDFATVVAEQRVVSPGLEVTGELGSAPGAVADIAAPVAGIVRWDLNRASPAEGALVEEGEPLVRLSPVGGDDTYASLKARAEGLQREVERAERLVAVEAVPARRLEDARHDLTVVQAQLEALDASPDETYTLTLRAPISGSVIRRDFVTGQRVEAGASLLTLLDPRRLHLRLHVPAVYASQLGSIVAATFTPEGSRAVYRTTRLLSVGVALDPIRRAVPVTFEVDNPDDVFKAGMLVNARLLSAEPDPVLAVPADAIVDEDGLFVAYVMTGGETFERRVLTVDATDGEWTTVLSGVLRGERVVTRGQYQIKLASLNTSEISDVGHAH
ncbi:MAG: efflux RND transporter periplasmic adaptor subunit [Gemmatimonadetes bacterium]|jgi:RND family efflux transporter MFP subunit|nr:efflux RND transporter periplasmic adaptor subunit [Gemmatimonadota bacterium]